MGLSFTVVINTLNRAAHLRTALASLRHQRHRAFEVVVVNGPSTDDTEAVLALWPDIKVARCTEANLSMSRNIGIAMAEGDVVAFLDDDATPEPDWLEHLEDLRRALRGGATVSAELSDKRAAALHAIERARSLLEPTPG